MTENEIQDLIKHFHKRLAWISEQEANSALIDGSAAQGHFDPEREQIIKTVDGLLKQWEELIKKRGESK